MRTDDRRDWDDAYANMAHVKGSERLPALWAERAAAYRASGVRLREDVGYGPGPRQRFDLVLPEGAPLGLVVFVHGGYWMRLSRSDWTDLAEGARASGWAVAIPGYTLTPAARIAGITREIAAAVTAAAREVAGPIRLAGHSAGGHLVTRMICDDSPLEAGLRARIVHTLSISGLHDLRPLLWTRMNETLRLDEAEAEAESPALRRPAGRPRLTCRVGTGERPEFVRQARLMAMIWEGLEAETRFEPDEGHDHFSILEGLKDPESSIVASLLSDR